VSPKDGSRWLPFVSHGKPAARRAVPIHAYVGPNGSGKSLAAVYDTLPSLAGGRPVLSTVRLHDFEHLRPCDDLSCMSPRHGLPDHYAAHPLWIPFVDFRQLLEVEHCDVLMDEVTGVASSRESSSMPVQVANYLVQLRRRNIVLRWTTPSWGRADIIIREVTQSVTYMVGMLPQSRPQEAGEAPRVWRDNRVLHARSYDPLLMDEFESQKADVIPAESTSYYWGPGSLVRDAYDTLDPVTALGWANESGMCMQCGGKRSLTKCGCGTAHKGGPATGAERVARITAAGWIGQTWGCSMCVESAPAGVVEVLTWV